MAERYAATERPRSGVRRRAKGWPVSRRVNKADVGDDNPATVERVVA